MTSDLSATVWWDDEHGVARIDWPAGSTCGLPEAKVATDAVIALGRGMVPLLVDARFMAKIDRPAREHFVHDPGDVSSLALLAESAVSKVLANFVIGMQRMTMPVRMFTNMDEALKWLASQGTDGEP